ncbi:hypothetical protein [Halorarum halobium]|uniref:hypothetical protein n=1 Tax=Halorarum halobium TaxID=3075121 RepID=UPI0028AB9E6B|nr:hypothetical protein [Halobaculum sp. XH14]
MSGETEEDVDDEEAGAHLGSVPAGAGCTEIWEELSEQREENAADGRTDDGERIDADEDR